MANKRTIALTSDQYKLIIDTLRQGFAGCRPNNRVATILVLEANLGLRLSDILCLRLTSFKKEAGRYHLDIEEIKTGKPRTFTVPLEIYDYVRDYCDSNGIAKDKLIFWPRNCNNIETINKQDLKNKERAVQKQLALAVDYLGPEYLGDNYTDIGTHSFRKYFASEIYVNNNYNIVLVQQLLQHASAATTQKYIGISTKDIEDALGKHIHLL